MKPLAIVLVLIFLGGCNLDKPRITYEGGTKHYCSVKPDHPMIYATYCEWNYARGYAQGLKDCCKYPSRREHTCHLKED